MDEQGRADRASWQGEMFRLLAENVLDYAVFIVDPNRHVLSWSKGAERLLGFTEEEIIGQKCDRFFAPEDVRAGVPQKELDQALATGRGDDDRWHVRKDGSRFWASGAVTPLKDESGTLRGFAKIMRDRTELKLAEDEARERERQLEFVTDHAPVLIAHCDADRRYKFVNKPYAARFGLHPREVVGRRIRDVLGGPVYAAIERHIDAALAGERVEFEVELPYAGQGPQVMRCAYDPEFDGDGKVEGFVAAIVNVTEPRRAEAALAASRRRLQALFDNTLDAILLADDQARYVDANHAACKLLGYDREELLRRGVFDITPMPNGEAGRAAWAAFVRDGQQSGEYVVSRKDGTTAVVEYRAVANVQPGLHLSVLRDVSERRKTEEALRESERRFRTLTTHAPVGIFQTDPDGHCLFVNDCWCQITGLSPEEAADEGWVRALHPEDRGRVRDEWYAAASSGREFAAEYRFRTPEGHTAWVHGKAVALRNEAGAITGHLGTVMDITERKRAEEEAFKVQEIFKLVHSIGRVGHWEWNSLTDENRWSPEIEALYGLPPGGFEGTYQAWAKLLHPDDLPRAEEDVRRALETGKYFTEFRVIWPDGSVHWLEARAYVFKDGHDKPVRIMGVNMDVTERKRIEEALKEADRRKDEFLAMLAHELRNPLAPIRNAAQVIRLLGATDPNVQRSTEMVERQVQTMTRLVDDLLDVSRITSGKIKLQKEPVELAAVVARAVETARPLMDARRHELTVTLPPQAVRLEADATRLAQVVGNLLTNSAKYSEEGGRIWLTADCEGSTVVVRVRDTGVGIPPEMLPRIFDLFTQVDRSLARSEGGLGIGLTLVKSLVEMHGGGVEARSEGAGKGSEFVVRLPVLETSHVPTAGKPDRGRDRPMPSRRILVVDDNVDAAESLAMLLRVERHDVRTAHDGATALQVAEAFHPEVVLLDLGLPRMDGFEVARRLRGQAGTGKALLVALTGYGQEDDRRRSGEAGFDAHLVKPADPAALEKLLAELKSQTA